MAEGVKASFYLRFCDVLGEDPSTAMRKIVDEGIKIDSEFVETLQKQQKDAEEALKAAKLLAAVSGATFTDPGLDISMKDEYEKASKLLASTEQLWDTLQTEDFEALPTTETFTSQASSTQASSLEEQIMRDMLGDPGGGGAGAGSPSSSIRSDATMSLYDQMDAMLGSISAGSFSSPNNQTAQPASSPSQAAPLPPLRAPSRPGQSPAQPQQQQPSQPTAKQPAAAQPPPPPLASRPALSAASGRADTDDAERSAAELERRAVELEEELFPGLAGQDALLEADAVTVARERLQAVKSGQADIGSSFDSAALDEDRFPDLDLEGVSMDSLLAAQAQPRAKKAKPPPPPQPAQPAAQLASRPKAPPPPKPAEVEEPAPTPTAAAPKSPILKPAAKSKPKKKRAARKPATEAKAAPPTPTSAAPASSAAAPPQPVKPPPPPRAPEKPKQPEKSPQTTTPPKPTPPRAAAAPESAPKAPEAAKKPREKANNSVGATHAASAAAQPTAARPRRPPEPAAAPDRTPETPAELAAEAGGDAGAADSGPLSPAEAAALWAERSAEAELARPLSRPELRPAARSTRMLDDAIEQTLVEAGKMPRAKAGKAALPKKRRKAQRGAAMKALDPEAMSKLLTPSPVAAQQAQKAGFVMRRPSAAPITSARMGDMMGEFVGPAEGGEVAVPAEPAPSLSARPVAPEPTPDSAEADAEDKAEAAAEATSAPAAPGEPFYAMIAYISAEGAHVTFGDRQSGVLPPALMSRHTAALLEDSMQPQAGGAEAFQPRLIRVVIADPRPDGTAVVSERGAYTFADVSTDAVSAALDPLIAEALLAAEARVEAYVWGPPDDGGGCLALFKPPAADLGIAQALLDTSGLPQMEAYLVDERADRPESALPNLTWVQARVCGDGLANGVLKLTVLSTEHDTLLRKLAFEDAAMNARELPPEMLRFLSALARFGEVPALRVQQLLGSPTPAEQPQLYIGKEEKDVDKGGGVVERCMALHCKHLIVSCAVQSTLSRDQFMLALQTIVAETSSEPTAGPR